MSFWSFNSEIILSFILKISSLKNNFRFFPDSTILSKSSKIDKSLFSNFEIKF